MCFYKNPYSTQAGYFSDTSLPIKQVVSIPVILTGGITTPQQAEELLSQGVADLIGVGRAI
jgi:NADPH2 dehydrogenase